jgi:ABC-type cobalamin/Fe3+-siderophores transport system ATPase subunit
MPNSTTESFQQTSSLDLVGRTEFVSSLINKLRDNYFVSVSGPVGSGKSTLVKNLLTQELFNNTELDGRVGNDWRVVYIR